MTRSIDAVIGYAVKCGLTLAAVASLNLVTLNCGAVETSVVVAGLDAPCGLAIRPDWFQIYVAESGAGRVVRIDDGQPRECISGFSVAKTAWLPERAVGPLGLCFVARDQLAVGQAGAANDKEVLSVFELERPLDAKDSHAKGTNNAPEARTKPATDTIGVLGPVELPAVRGKPKVAAWGDFWSVVAEDGCLYATSQESPSDKMPSRSAGIAFARFRTGKNGPLATFLKPENQIQQMRAMTLSPEGHLVVGTISQDSTTTGSLIFCNTRTGKQLSRFTLAIKGLVAIAFHPENGLLYGLDSGYSNSEKPNGMLYRLDSKFADGHQSIVEVPVTALARPTAMAFGVGGELFVTVLGDLSKSNNTAGEGNPDELPAGALLRITDLK